jgi:hypothetical protein
MGMFIEMVENNTITMKNFEKTNLLLEKVHHQMDWFINKLYETYFNLESNGVVGKNILPSCFNFFS